MKQELFRKLPQWFLDISPNDFYLVLTNDMDSYFSCRILTKYTGVAIGGFYSFDRGLYVDENYTKGKEPIYVDLGVTSGKAFDNHYTFIQNPENVNPNIIKRQYFQKYNGGTLALVASLFDHMEQFTEYQWMTILSVDSFYYGYYNRGGSFRNINLYWFDELGITEYVVPILEKNTESTFEQFISDEKLNESIKMNSSGELICKKHLELPDRKFRLIQEIDKRFVSEEEALEIYRQYGDNIVVSNEAYLDRYVLNLKK